LFDKSKLNILVKPPLYALLAALSLGINYVGYISGINLTTPSIGQIFIQSGPVLLALFGIIFFKERISIRQLFGLMVVLIGLSLFYMEQILNLAGGIREYKMGVVFVLIGGVAWAIYGVFQKLAVRSSNPMQLNLILFGLPALLLLPFVSFGQFVNLELNDWLLLVFLGLNTLGAYGALSYAFKYLDNNKISVIITLNPLITLVVMAYLSNVGVEWIEPEVFTSLTLVGVFVVLLGVILTVVRDRKSI
jgi:drug/metabolite transporter (DMT)-like permease